MSQRTSAILWLIIALFCGFLSLVACAGGGYGIWHTHTKVKFLEKSIEEDDRELNDIDPKKFVKGARLDLLEKRLRESDKEKAEFERYRYFAIAAAAISVIPGLMTLAFLVVAVAKFMKSRPAADDDEEVEEDEEPPEKKPTPKAKTKPKIDDGFFSKQFCMSPTPSPDPNAFPGRAAKTRRRMAFIGRRRTTKGRSRQ
jgi:hypothetical protein